METEQERAEGHELTNQYVAVHRLAGLVRDNDDAGLRRALPELLPWSRSLPDHDTDLLTAEFTGAVRGGASLTELLVLLTQWRHSAEIYADPDLLRNITMPIEGDGAGRVPPPPD